MSFQLQESTMASSRSNGYWSTASRSVTSGSKLDSGTIQIDDAVNIQFTSGTTGLPKGATLSHHNLINNGFFVGEATGIAPGSRVCIPVPLYHCFGMVMGNLGCVTHARDNGLSIRGLRSVADAGDR